MSDRHKGLVPGMVPSSLEDYKVLHQMLAFWDLSKDPVDNSDRERKLGFGYNTKFVALNAFDPETGVENLKDGLDEEEPFRATSSRSANPDNWILRFHTDAGKDPDATWDLRLVADHENKSDKRTHQSTMVMNQCDDQDYAWLQDAFWVLKLGTPVTDLEIKLNSAGFLQFCYFGAAGTPTGKETRGTLMSNVSKQGGYMTDANRVGQIWHLIDVSSKSASDASGDCGAVEKAQVNLRGDYFTRFGSLWSQWLTTLTQPDSFRGDLFGGLIAPNHDGDADGEGTVLPPDDEMKDDPSSNQPELPVEEDKKIVVTVFIYTPDLCGCT